MTISRNLFKFVSIRPPEEPDQDSAELAVIRLESGEGPQTPFLKELEAAATLNARRNLARDFVRSDNYARPSRSRDGVMRYLLGMYGRATEAVRRAERPGDFKRFMEREADARPAAAGAEEAEVRRRVLWDSLIAAYLAPRANPHDRAALINALRALHLYQKQDAIESADDFRRAVRATPVIPTWVLAESKPPQRDLPSEDKPAVDKERWAEIEKLRGEVRSADAILADLEASYAAYAREREDAKSPADEIEIEPPAGGRGEGVQPSAVRMDRSEPPWRAREQVFSRLPEKHAEKLATIDTNWRLRAPDELRAKVSRSRSAAQRQLVKLGGRRAADVLIDLKPGDIQITKPGGAISGPSGFTNPIAGSVGSVKPLGFGDLLIVEETLLRYEEAEVAHIENVMQSETRERIHRRLDREVETTFTSVEESEETERDLQSTERYELATEIEETISNEMSLETGLAISASYGPVLSMDASADFAISNSSEKTTNSSTNFAQEVVDKSVSRLSKKIKEEITRKTLSEIEETNTHGFDNTSGDGHLAGVYRWVDQVWQAQIKNYGKRLMLEFILPEPAAFYKQARLTGVDNGITKTPPEPLEDNFSFLDVKPNDYETWVDRYQVPDVAPPPPEFTVVNKVIELPEKKKQNNNDSVYSSRTDAIAIPAGYAAREAWVYFTGNHYLGTNTLHIHVGRRIFDKDKANNDDYKTLHDEEGQLAVGVYSHEFIAAMISIEVRCERTENALREWQLETFKKIVDTYNAQQAAYEAHVASVENLVGGALNDLHPDKKALIEKDELKRGALVLLTDQHFSSFNAMTPNAPPEDYPEIDVDEAMEEGPYIQFFEQLCEWEQMTYIYYPYFWGRKSEWINNALATDSDFRFETFLKAGAARVQVPVRPGYEKALAYYLETAEIWNGGDVPVVDSELYVSIVDEIAESQGAFLSTATDEGEPWEFTLPTQLVKLQEDATLPSWES